MKLKEIAPYLAHEVKFTRITDNIKYRPIEILNCDNVKHWEDGKAIYHMRPLSDLTKPCLEGGGVPILELAKLTEPSWNWKMEYGQAHYWKNERLEYWFGYNKEFESFDLYYYANELEIIDKKPNSQLSLFNWLYEHHFWLGDQDRFGKDIVDINDLKQTK